VQGHDEIVWAVEIHAQRLFSASADKTIRVWDIASKRCEQVIILLRQYGTSL
jgi:F-box/WD-40 domain protein 7